MFGKIRVLGLAVLCATIVAAPPMIGAAEEDGAKDAVDTYFDAIDAFRQGRTEQALGEMGRAIRAFSKENFEKGEFMARLSMATMYRRQGQYEKALGELRKAEEMKVRSKDLLGEGLVLLRMADLEMDRSRFDEADKLIEKAMANVTALEDKTLVAAVRLRQARILALRGRYSGAREALGQSLKLFRDMGDPAGEATALAQLGELDRLVGTYNSSLNILAKARKVAQEAGLEREQRLVAFYRALTLASEGKTREAGALLRKSMDAFTVAGDTRNAARARTCYADVMMRVGDTSALLKDVEEAAKDFERLKANYELAQNKLVEGRLLTLNGKLRDAAKVLEQARKTFEEIHATHGEFSSHLALAVVRSHQGAFISAWQNADRGAELARTLGTPRELADSARVKGVTAIEQGDFEAALPRFDRALKLYRALKDATGEAACYAGRAYALIQLGFLARAGTDLKALKTFSESPDDLMIRGDLLFLFGRMALAQGNELEAQMQFRGASVVYSKFALPIRQAMLLEANAERECALRNVANAGALWERAEKAYGAMSSPGGVLRCREARVSLALDRKDFAGAEALVRRRIRTSAGITSATPGPIRVAQASGSLYASDADQDRFFREMGPWPDAIDRKRGDQREGTGQDAQLFNARFNALKARVALASGNTAAAEKLINQSLEVSAALAADRLGNRLTRILADIFLEKGDYEQARKALDKIRSVAPWEAAHVRGLVLHRKGKSTEALRAFAGAVGDLTRTEAREGLWLVSAAECRRRESLYEDYLDVLMNVAPRPDSGDTGSEAWKIAQRLKMRRVFYDRTMVGATGFPGVSDKLLNEKKTVQYEAINAAKRAAHPGLMSSQSGNKGAKEKREPTPEAISQRIEALFKNLSSESREYVEFVHARPPTLVQVRKRLAPNEVYVSFLVSRKGIYGFLITRRTFKQVALARTPDEIRKKAHSLMKDVAAPNADRITRASCDLWKKLFEPFGHPIPNGGKLVVEPDGFLTMFPFEALVPEEFPQSFKERQALQILMDRVNFVRTTCAARFVRSRDSSGNTKPASLAVFAAPVLPGLDSSARTGSASEEVFLPPARTRQLARTMDSGRVESAKLGARISRLFGDRGTLYYGERANVSTFLREGMSAHSVVHMLCPLLLPAIPVGRMRQPFLVFSGSRHDPWAGLCGATCLTVKPRPVALLTLTTLAGDRTGTERGLVLFLETLGFMGVRSVLLPLWPATRQSDTDTEIFMTGIYSALKDGAALTDAMNRARQALETAEEKRGRFRAARFVIF